MANGVLVSKTDSGDKTTWHWRESSPMVSYLATVTNGFFELRTSTLANGLPRYDAVDPQTRFYGEKTPRPQDAWDNLAVEPEAVGFLSNLYGAYAHDSVGGIVDWAPNVFFALETQTKPNYDVLPDELTIVHELAHQWFGDALVLDHWSDMWLNEGFATWSEWIWTERHGGQTAQQRFDQLYAITEDSTRGQDLWFPAPDALPGPPDLFGTPVYDRGAHDAPGAPRRRSERHDLLPGSCAPGTPSTSTRTSRRSSSSRPPSGSAAGSSTTSSTCGCSRRAAPSRAVGSAILRSHMETGTFRVKSGLAEMLKGGVIMDVVTPEQAQDRRGRGRRRGDGARARAGRHPPRRRRRAHERPDHDRGHQGGRLDPGDGEGPHRPLRRGAGARGARGGLHRRVRGAHAGRRGQPHRQVGLQGAVRLRRHQPGRGAPPHRRGRGDDPLEGRGRHRQRRRGRAPHAHDHRRDPPAPDARRDGAADRRQGAAGAARARQARWPRTAGCRSCSSAPAASPPRPTPR